MRRWIGGVPDRRQVAGRHRWLFNSRQAPWVQRVPDAA
jgi:hypothetical protein